MKYLNSYKIFENRLELIDRALDDISDILIELEDSNFVVSKHYTEVKKVSNKLCEQVIEIVIDKGGSKNFSYREIEDTCNRLISYMTGWNWSIMYFQIFDFVEFKIGGEDPLQTSYDFKNPYYLELHNALIRQRIEDCQAFKIVFYSRISRVIDTEEVISD